MNNLVEHKGRVFRFGDHVDGTGKKFSLSRAEYEAANEATARIPLGFDPTSLKHYVGKPNAFDGKYGHATSFAPTDPELTASLHMAPILAETVKEKGLRMSAIFGVNSKKLVQIDFVANSVIPDTHVFFGGSDGEETVAIFADESPFLPPGSEAHGDASEDVEDPLSTPDLAQHMHEIIANGYPGLCDPFHRSELAMHGDAEKHPSHLIALHDFCLHHGACCLGMPTQHAQFGLEDYPVAETEAPIIDPATAARLAALEEMFAAERSKRITAEVATFAKESETILPPATRPLFNAVFAALSSMPQAEEVVTFGEGESAISGSILNIFKQAVAGLRPLASTLEMVIEQSTGQPLQIPRHVPGGVVVFGNNQKAETGELTEADKKRLDRMAAQA